MRMCRRSGPIRMGFSMREFCKPREPTRRYDEATGGRSCRAVEAIYGSQSRQDCRYCGQSLRRSSQSNMIDTLKAVVPKSLRSVIRSMVRATYGLDVFYVRSRSEFAHILNARSLRGEGAEIGVQNGAYSETLLHEWQGEKL